MPVKSHHVFISLFASHSRFLQTCKWSVIEAIKKRCKFLSAPLPCIRVYVAMDVGTQAGANRRRNKMKLEAARRLVNINLSKIFISSLLMLNGAHWAKQRNNNNVTANGEYHLINECTCSCMEHGSGSPTLFFVAAKNMRLQCCCCECIRLITSMWVRKYCYFTVFFRWTAFWCDRFGRCVPVWHNSSSANGDGPI